MIAYKAVRPDGTDFHTGKILYKVGKTVTHPTSKQMVPNQPETYLSVSIEKADCTAFKWPCRLFRVQTVGKTLGGLCVSGNKRACLKLKVLEELPAWEALGPNGESVAALIEKAKTLTEEQAAKLDATWNAALDAALKAAWNAVVTRGAARDAVIALVVRDLIGDEHFDTLYGPWKSVMEPE